MLMSDGNHVSPTRLAIRLSSKLISELLNMMYRILRRVAHVWVIIPIVTTYCYKTMFYRYLFVSHEQQFINSTHVLNEKF